MSHQELRIFLRNVLALLPLIAGACGNTHRNLAGGTGGAGGVSALPEPAFHDGTRLVARTFSFSGTVELFAGVYDQQKQVDCEFRLATDGVLRCLPATSLGPVDPATVEPANQWQDGVATPGATTVGRLRLNEVHTSDGGRFPIGMDHDFQDTQLGVPCSPSTSGQKDGTGDGLCLPSAAMADGVFFSDGTCSQPLAISYVSDTPLLVSTQKRELFALGDPYEGAVFDAFSMGGSCVEYQGSGSFFFRIGEPLPASRFAALQILPQGSARLALRMIETEGRAVTSVRHRDLSSPSRSVEGPYLDRERGVMCRPTWTTAGDVRCVPADSTFVLESWLTNFADPACTQPVVPDHNEMAVVLRNDPTIQRDVIVEVRRVDTKPSSTAYTMQTGACREFLKGSGYPLGEVVPLESFARLDARTGH